MSLPQDIYSVADLKCTDPTLKELLREYKEIHKQIRIGSSKPETLANLREAIEGKLIPVERLQALIREGEENGDQHIFVYKPKASIKDQLRFDAVGAALGLNGRPFPDYTLSGDDWTWADFRDQAVQLGKGWTLKLYSQETSLVLKEKKEQAGPHIVRVLLKYEKVEDRRVYVACLDQYGVLELRVPRSESRKRVSADLATLWKKLQPALRSQDFVPWDVTDVAANMVMTDEEHADTFKVIDTSLWDSASGTAKFATSTEDEDIEDAVDRKRAVESILNGGGSARQIGVMFMSEGSGGALTESLWVLVGGAQDDYPNELIIRSSTTRNGVDYVIGQLRSFE
jgi:hypothetical protein